jgi:pyruvate/2-oxoglutarate/acetoin dehydrogenase E1 component
MKMNMTEAFDQALIREMKRDQRVICMCTMPMPALEREFGPDRMRHLPISENGFTGLAVGAALSGLRPVVVIRNTTFSLLAMDSIVNQAAKARYMTGGQASVPLVVRTEFSNGARMAAQHSQPAYSMYAQASGLKIIAPATPADAFGLLTAAVRSDDPVMCFEAARIASSSGDVPDDLDSVPIGRASVRREGDDVTIVGLLHTAGLAEAAADILRQDGIFAEVIDLRSIVPLDSSAIRASVRNTGRLIVVDESVPTCSVASEVLSLVVEDDETFGALRAPVRRVCSRPVPIPFSAELEDFVLPDVADVVTAVRSVLASELSR